MSKVKRIKRLICIHLINSFCCGTHFFGLKRKLLRSAGIKVGAHTCIVGPIYLGNVSKVSFGNHVWIGRNFCVHGNGGVSIGDHIDIAPDVSFVTGSHEIGEAQHRAGKGVAFNIRVENGCWIGTRATILGEITIQLGTVVAAGAVVNKTIGPNALFAGVPAKHIRDLTDME